MAVLNSSLVNGNLRVTGKVYGYQNAMVITNANNAVPPVGAEDNNSSAADYSIGSGADRNLPTTDLNYNIHTVVTHFTGTTYRVTQIATGTSSSKPTVMYERSGISSDGVTWSDWSSWKSTSMAGHTHAAGNITSGTLSVARGGTGIGTSTNVNAVVIGNSSSATGAMQTVAAANGAFYSTGANVKPQFGILPAAQGGTGKTSAKDACNAFINALDTGSSTPVDADYYVSQYVNGGTTTTTFHRRPMSALWTYIKGKLTSVAGVNISGNAATATADANGNTISSTYLKLSGGTMTGMITTVGDYIFDDGATGAIDLHNSNIVRVNGIYTEHSATNAMEGINFYRSNDGSNLYVDSLWVTGGNIYFAPNRTAGSQVNAANSEKVTRLPSTITDNQVVLTNGTTGLLKTEAASSLTVGTAGAISRSLAGSGVISATNIVSVTGSTDGFKMDYAASASDQGTMTLYTTDDANAKISIGNTVSGTYTEAISVVNGSATVKGSLTGTASKATADASGNPITSTYLKISDASSTYEPLLTNARRVGKTGDSTKKIIGICYDADTDGASNYGIRFGPAGSLTYNSSYILEYDSTVYGDPTNYPHLFKGTSKYADTAHLADGLTSAAEVDVLGFAGGGITSSTTYDEIRAMNKAAARATFRMSNHGNTFYMPLSCYDKSPNNSSPFYFTGLSGNTLYYLKVSAPAQGSDATRFEMSMIPVLTASSTVSSVDDLEPILTVDRGFRWNSDVGGDNRNLRAIGFRDTSIVSNADNNFLHFGMIFNQADGCLFYHSSYVIATSEKVFLSNVWFEGTAVRAKYDANGVNIANTYMKASSGTYTLSYGTTTTIGTVDGNSVLLSMPAKPTTVETAQTALSLTGTLGVANGGTGKTSASDAANAFLLSLPNTWTATPSDDTYLLRKSTNSEEYGQIKFLHVWNYIKNKVKATDSTSNYMYIAKQDSSHDAEFMCNDKNDGNNISLDVSPNGRGLFDYNANNWLMARSHQSTYTGDVGNIIFDSTTSNFGTKGYNTTASGFGFFNINFSTTDSGATWNDFQRSGIYRIFNSPATGTSNSPGSGEWGLLVISTSSGNIMQQAYKGMALYARYKGTGQWGSWKSVTLS